ncbi:hypothetical protein N9P85_00630 [Amylibacter sp.]|nr:hypothetical protein [Amylibacter sp.]
MTIVLSVNIFVCLFQMMGLQFLFDEILIRQFARGFGVSGIYGEPSFLALALISLSTIYLVKPAEAASNMKTRLVLLLTMMSGSTVGLFQFMVLFLASKRKFLIALITFLASLAVIMYLPRVIRITQVVVNLYNQGFMYILVDGSLGARYAYIQRDIVYFIENFGYVRGFGTYGSAIDNFSVSFFDEKFPYDTSLSGSLMGRYMVELNFLIVLMLGLVTLRACLYRRSILYIFFIFLFLSFQMISTFFGPFIFALGFVCNEIFRKG